MVKELVVKAIMCGLVLFLLVLVAMNVFLPSQNSLDCIYNSLFLSIIISVTLLGYLLFVFLFHLTGPVPSSKKLLIIGLVYGLCLIVLTGICMNAWKYPLVKIIIGEATVFITLASYIAYVALSRVITERKRR